MPYRVFAKEQTNNYSDIIDKKKYKNFNTHNKLNHDQNISLPYNLHLHNIKQSTKLCEVNCLTNTAPINILQGETSYICNNNIVKYKCTTPRILYPYGLHLLDNDDSDDVVYVSDIANLNANNNHIPKEVQNIRILMMNLLIIPFISKQWNRLEENINFIENLTNKINKYLSIYINNEYLLLYKDVLAAFETIVLQHIEIRNLEKYFTDNNDENGKKVTSSLVFKTTMLRLKPEYELYNLIVGEPNLKKDEKYNDSILNDIIKLLQVDTTSFEIIKNYIIEKYDKFIEEVNN